MIKEKRYYPKGEYYVEWDGFDQFGIYDSKVLRDSENLQIRVIGITDENQKHYIIKDPIIFSYKEVYWVDVRIDKIKKRIDCTLRVNLKDGGANGVECTKIPHMYISQKGDNTVCPWDNIPSSIIKPHQPIIKTRTKTFEELIQLALKGINYHWGRNKKHAIAEDVKINKESYEVYINSINTETNAMDDVDLLFNTNSYWARSNNPGCVSSFKSLVANIAQYVPLNETIFYNVGYLNYNYEYQEIFLLKKEDWNYLDNRSMYKKSSVSNIDKDFSYTAAHEIGHNILRAYSEGAGGSADYSYKHKGSSGYADTKTPNDGGLLYPDSDSNKEIDLMKYYNNEPFWKDFDRIVAEEIDVLGLIWLTKLEVR